MREFGIFLRLLVAFFPLVRVYGLPDRVRLSKIISVGAEGLRRTERRNRKRIERRAAIASIISANASLRAH